MESYDQSSSRVRGRLGTLEAGRGIAALLVVLFHFGGSCADGCGPVPSLSVPFRAGHAGVEYFFALSGFIIYFAHARDIGKPNRLLMFFRKRIVRIIPMYWMVITILLALSIIHHSGLADGKTIWSVISNYFLIPTAGPRILAPAWTLEREVLFYLIFSLSILSPGLGVIVFAGWQLTIIAVNIGCFFLDQRPSEIIWYFFGVHNLGFLVGVCCAIAMANYSLPSKLAQVGFMLLGALGVLGTMSVEIVTHLGPQSIQTASEEIAGSTIYALSFGLLIYGFAAAEQSFPLAPKGFLSTLGASSYLIYLIHLPVGAVVMDLFAAIFGHGVVDPNLAYLSEVLITIAVAVLCHFTVEGPITRRLRRTSDSRSAEFSGFKNQLKCD